MRFSVGNVEEHAANTAVGLKDNGTTLLMATIDGLDGCPMGNATCGNSFTTFWEPFLCVTNDRITMTGSG